LPGPLAGVHAAALHFPDDYLVTVAVDLPFLPRNLVARMRAVNRELDCIYATCGGQHALAILWGPDQAESIAAFLDTGGRRITEWLGTHGKPVVIPPSPFEDLRFNINTPADLACAERRILTGNWDSSQS
jgi:molybdopterin-guanine dinucleotide biosynthesis protein A